MVGKVETLPGHVSVRPLLTVLRPRQQGIPRSGMR